MFFHNAGNKISSACIFVFVVDFAYFSPYVNDYCFMILKKITKLHFLI